MPPHSSHLLQPLDVGCFSPMKRAYGREVKVLIKSHVTYITKIEFFITFQAAFRVTFIKENVKAGFKGAGLIPFDPEAVLLKLDIKLRTPLPLGSRSISANPWVSQTPHNLTEAVL